MIPKFEKRFPLVCRACRVKSIDNITHCNLINIHALFVYIFFGFLPKFRKRILNLKEKNHLFVELVETNLLMYNINDLR